MKRAMLHGAKALGRVGRANNTANAALLGEGLVEGPTDRATPRFPRRPSLPVSLVVAVIAWVSLAAWQALAIAGGYVTRDVPRGLESGEYVLEVVEDAKLGSYGYSMHARVLDANGVARDVLATYGDADIEGDARLFARQRVVASVSFSEFSEASFSRYASKGLCARAKLTQATIVDGAGPISFVASARCFARDVFDEFEGRGAALVRAIVIGDRSKLEEGGLYDDVKTVGLAHMVAVSGAHLSVVAALAGALLARARMPRVALSIALCLFYCAYAAFTGFSAPVIRAALMAAVVVSAIWGARRSSSLAALGVCVCVLLAVHPTNALSLSFFLSAASTLGIVALAPLMQAWFEVAFGRRAETLCQTCALTTAANIPIAPVTACVFSRVPLMSPLANMIAAPLFTVFIAGGLVGLGLTALYAPAGKAILAAIIALAQALSVFLAALARVPFASLPCSADMWVVVVLSALAFAGLWVIWPRPTRARAVGVAAATALVVVACVVAAPLLEPDEIVALDVGQGDAILVKSEGASLLVDTGNQDAMLAAALARTHTPHLSGVAISHHDDDHCASLDSLASTIAGSCVYVARETYACPCDGCADLLAQARNVSGRQAVGLDVGDEIRVGRFTCRVVWPRAFSDAGGNADSLCLLVSYENEAGPLTALLTGDAEAEQIEKMVQSGGTGSSEAVAVNVLKAGHHGSKAGMTPKLAQGLSANIALVSCGANNRYGHPAQATIDALEAAGTRVFRTDELGDIACVFSREGIEVRPQYASGVALE